jgi:hypothetical protein
MNDIVIAGCPPQSAGEILPWHLAELYDYIKQHVISCPDNQDQLIERTKELYWEILPSVNGEESYNSLSLVIPPIQSIADQIDTENVEAIFVTAIENGFSEEDSDNLIALYAHDIGCALDTYIGEILWSIGFPINDKKSISRPLFRSPFQPGQLFFNFKEV